jgi:chaperonin GroEL
MGAMLCRHVVWRLHEQMGDGTATAAAVAARLLRELNIAVEAGFNSHLLHDCLDRALPVLQATLRELAKPVEDRDVLTRLIAGALPEPDLAALIAEPLDALGADATIEVLESHRGESSTGYRDGATWNGRCASRFFFRDHEATARLVDARVFVTEHPLESAEQLLPLLECCLAHGERSLLVVAPKIGDAAIGLLLANRDRGVFTGMLAVIPPGNEEQQRQVLADIAAIAGARCLSIGRGGRLADVTVADLGAARQVWATPSAFGLQGGGGKIAHRRQRLRDVQTVLGRIAETSSADRLWLQTRAGNLAGVTAELRIGAPTRSAHEALKHRVEAALATGRAALREGCIPGGGSALLAAASALPEGCSDEEKLVHRALRRALSEPMTAIARNAGLDPAPIVAEAARRGAGRTYDVLSHRWVDPWETGILDPVAVTLRGLELGLSMVGTALTVDVLVHPRELPPRRQ